LPLREVVVAQPDLLRRTVAEGLAAFVLVFAGCGAIVTDATRATERWARPASPRSSAS